VAHRDRSSNALAECVDAGVAFDALSELVDSTPDAIPQEVLGGALPVGSEDER